MKILGISGSPRPEKQSGVYILVKTVLDNTGLDYDIVSLRGKTIAGCIACLGCVKDNVCVVKDDLAELRQKIVDADAYVIGSPNYYDTINVLTHAFLERWFQFRHQEGDSLWGKLAVTVGVGGTSGDSPAEHIERFLMYNFVETVAKVSGQGAASCFSCGYTETCKVGIPTMLFGQGFTLEESMVPDVTRQPQVMENAVQAGKLLGERLKNNHDRMAVTQAMQEKMMALFGSSL